MSTILKYLNDTYLYQLSTDLVSIDEDEHGEFATFSETVFYPQGGGQQSDTGVVMLSSGGDNKWNIQVRHVLFKNGKVNHYGNFSELKNENINGIKAFMDIDVENRLNNSKLHTAGHLIASIVERIEPKLRATKGFHFNEGSYVGFDILSELAVEKEQILEELTKVLENDIKDNLAIDAQVVDYETLQASCSYVPPYLPKDKPLRIVTIGGYEPIPCGGTHISSLDQLQSVTIRKAKKKGGSLKISYAIV